MTLPDLDDLTPDQLRALLSQASSRLEQLARDEAETETQLRNDIGTTVDALEVLIGDGDPKGVGSIVGVRQYTGEEMVGQAATILPVIVHGIELLARSQLDIARVVGTTARPADPT